MRVTGTLLDDVKEFLHAAVRGTERHASEQQNALAALGNEEGEWLEVAQQTLVKGVNFHMLQVACSQSIHMHTHVHHTHTHAHTHT